MNVLAIESSTKTASCAICCEQDVLATSSISVGLFHSKTLMVLVDELFKQSKIDLKTIDAVCISKGPGSFTGLRIGMAAAKGIAFGLEKPLIAVDTLESLAYNLLGTNSFVCPCLDARRDTVYTAFFEIVGFKITRIKEDCAIEILELNEFFKNADKTIFLVGDAAQKCYEKLKDNGHVMVAPANLKNPMATSVAFLGIEKLKSNKIEKEIAPKYLKLSQAERELKEKNKFFCT